MEVDPSRMPGFMPAQQPSVVSPSGHDPQISPPHTGPYMAGPAYPPVMPPMAVKKKPIWPIILTIVAVAVCAGGFYLLGGLFLGGSGSEYQPLPARTPTSWDLVETAIGEPIPGALMDGGVTVTITGPAVYYEEMGHAVLEAGIVFVMVPAEFASSGGFYFISGEYAIDLVDSDQTTHSIDQEAMNNSQVITGQYNPLSFQGLDEGQPVTGHLVFQAPEHRLTGSYLRIGEGATPARVDLDPVRQDLPSFTEVFQPKSQADIGQPIHTLISSAETTITIEAPPEIWKPEDMFNQSTREKWPGLTAASSYDLEPGQVFMVVPVTVTNDNDMDFSFLSFSDIVLVTPDGQAHEYHYGGMSDYNLPTGEPNPFISKGVRPGDTMSGAVVYAVDKDAIAGSYLLMSLYHDTIKVDLGF